MTSATSVTNLPFTSDIPGTTSSTSMTATTGNTAPTTSVSTTSTGVKSSCSNALAVAMARETGFAAGLMAAIGGVAMLIRVDTLREDTLGSIFAHRFRRKLVI